MKNGHPSEIQVRERAGLVCRILGGDHKKGVGGYESCPPG